MNSIDKVPLRRRGLLRSLVAAGFACFAHWGLVEGGIQNERTLGCKGFNTSIFSLVDTFVGKGNHFTLFVEDVIVFSELSCNTGKLLVVL